MYNRDGPLKITIGPLFKTLKFNGLYSKQKLIIKFIQSANN